MHLDEIERSEGKECGGQAGWRKAFVIFRQAAISSIFGVFVAVVVAQRRLADLFGMWGIL